MYVVNTDTDTVTLTMAPTRSSDVVLPTGRPGLSLAIGVNINMSFAIGLFSYVVTCSKPTFRSHTHTHTQACVMESARWGSLILIDFDFPQLRGAGLRIVHPRSSSSNSRARSEKSRSVRRSSTPPPPPMILVYVHDDSDVRWTFIPTSQHHDLRSTHVHWQYCTGCTAGWTVDVREDQN